MVTRVCFLIDAHRQMGLNSLPVAFGVDTAKYICVGSIDVTQLGVAAYLAFGLHQTTYAAVLLGLILPQIFFQVKYFLPDPIENDVTYQVSTKLADVCTHICLFLLACTTVLCSFTLGFIVANVRSVCG